MRHWPTNYHILCLRCHNQVETYPDALPHEYQIKLRQDQSKILLEFIDYKYKQSQIWGK